MLRVLLSRRLFRLLAAAPVQIATYKVRTVRVVDERAMNDSANENSGDLSNAGEQSLAAEDVSTQTTTAGSILVKRNTFAMVTSSPQPLCWLSTADGRVHGSCIVSFRNVYANYVSRLGARYQCSTLLSLIGRQCQSGWIRTWSLCLFRASWLHSVTVQRAPRAVCNTWVGCLTDSLKPTNPKKPWRAQGKPEIDSGSREMRETWMLLEYADRGNLDRALVQGKFMLPDGRLDLVRLTPQNP